MNGDVAVDFGQVSRIYDKSRYAIPEKVEKLAECLGLSPRSTVVDLGCGTGNFAHALSARVRHMVGVDLSPGMLRTARAKFPGLPLVIGDATSLPFGDEAFDCAFAVQVLHHVRERLSFMKEVYRALKKGGRIGIDTCSHRQMKTFWFYHYFPGGLELDLARIPDCSAIAGLLETAGFSEVGVQVSYTDIAYEHLRPERYLDADYRNGMSTFRLLPPGEIEAGCWKLSQDMASGEAEVIIARHAAMEDVAGGSSIVFGKK